MIEIIAAIFALVMTTAIMVVIDETLLNNTISDTITRLLNGNKKKVLIGNSKLYDCSICGNQFEIKKENLKIVSEASTAFSPFTTPVKKFEAIDCPNCGCQKVLQVRMDEVKK